MWGGVTMQRDMATKPRATKAKRTPTLESFETLTASEIEKRRKARPKRTQPTQKTQRRKKQFKDIPRPVALSSAELKAINPDDPDLISPIGGPRKIRGDHWKEAAREEHVRRRRARRAQARKREARVSARVEETGIVKADYRTAGDLESTLIAAGEMDMDEWSPEELIRGYRRNRNGKFGKPPKHIPREVQQEALRRLIKHGQRRLGNAYIKAVEDLVKIAQDENVRPRERLDAIREIMNRVGGKVPDHTVISTESPWQDLLVDAIAPIIEDRPKVVVVRNESGGTGTRGDDRVIPDQSPPDATSRHQRDVEKKWED